MFLLFTKNDFISVSLLICSTFIYEFLFSFIYFFLLLNKLINYYFFIFFPPPYELPPTGTAFFLFCFWRYSFNCSALSKYSVNFFLIGSFNLSFFSSVYYHYFEFHINFIDIKSILNIVIIIIIIIIKQKR